MQAPFAPLLAHKLTWPFAPAGPLGRIADQAAGHLPALDPDADIDDAARLAQRRVLLQALVRIVAVMVEGVPALTFAEMPLGDQHLIQALAAVRSGEPFRTGACRGSRNGVLMIRVPFPASTSGAVAGARQQGAYLRCWAVQAPAGWTVTARMRTARAWISLTDSTYTRLSRTVRAGRPIVAL